MRRLSAFAEDPEGLVVAEKVRNPPSRTLAGIGENGAEADLGRPFGMLWRGPSKQTFAARAKRAASRMSGAGLFACHSADANVCSHLLREMTGFAAERLMELEVGAVTGAAYGEKNPARRAQHMDRIPRPT